MSDWFDAEAHADRALEMFERGRLAEAESELRKALALNPDHPEWQFNLGLTLEASGRDIDALDSYRRAAELMPTEAEPRVAAGAVCNRLQRFSDAIEYLEAANSIEPRHEAAYAHRIESHFRMGDHDGAETTFYLSQQALDEPSPPCLAIMAESLIERREFDRAGWCLREAIRLDPTMPRIRARLAAVCAATNMPQRALQLYLRDLRDDPGNIETLLDYGELLIGLGRHVEAGEKFRRVLELEPANIDAHHRLGQIAMAAGRHEAAHMEFELVYKLDSDYPQIRMAIAETLIRRERTAEAQTFLRHQLDLYHGEEQDSRATFDLVRFGRLLLQSGMPRDAAQILEDGLRRDGESPELLRQLALARFDSGDRDGGVIASRRVIRLDPACIPSMHNLAMAALDEGRLRTASGWISRGLRIDRHDEGLRRLRVRLWLAAVVYVGRRFTRKVKAGSQRAQNTPA
ncbi:MAG: tetratricopeptide repeat protein [Planctomycetota bacterium]